MLLEKLIRWGNVGREAGNVILDDFVLDVWMAAKELGQNYERPLKIKRHVHLNASFHSWTFSTASSKL